VVGLGFISLGFSVLAREMLVVMTTPEFYAASTVVPLILISYLFYGVRFMTNYGLVRENKLKYASMIIIGTAVINLGLNYWLIPRYGMIGAAWSTLISYGVLLIAHMIVNLRFWPISYEYWRIAKVGIVWAVIYISSLQITASNIIWSIFIKMLMLLSYPVLLYLIRFFKQEELVTLKGIIISRTKKLEHLWKTD
jgi:O-antigen/teichoic acid export membrane protein